MSAVLLVVKVGPGAKKDKTSRSASNTTPTLVTTTSAGPVKYTVKQGDTLLRIAEYFGVTSAAIVRANQLPDPDHLFAGQVLTIPPVTPIVLVIEPAKPTTGETIELTLTGAQPGEYVTFEIHRPAGVFKGRSHLAGEDGTVTTTYSLGAEDTPGTYTVVAKGDQITTAQATFEVVAPKTPAPQ
jgi:spore germination protein YaaH